MKLLNIFEKKFKNTTEAKNEYEKIEGVKYGQKLYNDYLRTNSLENELKYADKNRLLH
jgi:hypothetical protein